MPALVEIVDAVGHDVEVLVDGGIRRGSDVARAIALGARAAMVGRPWVFALTAGQAGVERMLEIFRTDLDRTLRLPGCAAVEAPDRSSWCHPFSPLHSSHTDRKTVVCGNSVPVPIDLGCHRLIKKKRKPK